MLKAALCKKNAYLQGGAGRALRRAISQRALPKSPMCEIKFALRSKRQCVIVPRVKDA